MEVNNPYSYIDEALPEPDYSSDFESLPQPHSETPSEELTVQENAFAKHAVEIRPEAVQAHVENAAERDKPLEAFYERRHEIKDDDTVTPMIPISTVISEVPGRQPSLQSFGSQQLLISDDLPSDEDDYGLNISKLTYKQAMRFGFMGGLASIVLIVLAYFLLHK